MFKSLEKIEIAILEKLDMVLIVHGLRPAISIVTLEFCTKLPLPLQRSESLS